MKTFLQNKLAVRITAAVLAVILAGGVAARLIIRHQNKVFFSEAETKKRAAKREKQFNKLSGKFIDHVAFDIEALGLNDLRNGELDAVTYRGEEFGDLRIDLPKESLVGVTQANLDDEKQDEQLVVTITEGTAEDYALDLHLKVYEFQNDKWELKTEMVSEAISSIDNSFREDVFLAHESIFIERCATPFMADGISFRLRQFKYNGEAFEEQHIAVDPNDDVKWLNYVGSPQTPGQWFIGGGPAEYPVDEAARAAFAKLGFEATQLDTKIGIMDQDSTAVKVCRLMMAYDDAQTTKGYASWGSTSVGDVLMANKVGINSYEMDAEEETTLTGEEETDIFPDSSERALSEAEVAALSDYDLRIAINEIYARNHYQFQTPEMSEYFGKKAWYSGSNPDQTSVRSGFNSTEEANMKLLEKERDRR